MHASQVLAVLAFSTGALAQAPLCPGQQYNNICCVEGTWSGPVISSFVNNWSSVAVSAASVAANGAKSEASSAAGIATSVASVAVNGATSVAGQAASVATNIASQAQSGASQAIGFLTGLKARAIQTEVQSGLTCNGLAAVTISDTNAASTLIASITSGANSTFSQPPQATLTNNGQTLIGSSIAVATPGTSSSKAGAAMVTRAPMLAAGGAVLAFAYGAM
ncbi:hypothetical protein G7Y89_g11328 [Cudoniella acicularis]|uniref:Uncharacterized protein n=1 Tax=Cudoniella acicularis TaxID=354080 RepID=A0A8H4REP4_9HELO|nr:hypothetical protein G7Y89_g11328 [Cudoniella acicularis]